MELAEQLVKLVKLFTVATETLIELITKLITKLVGKIELEA